METRKDSGRLLVGIALLALGLIFLLNNFGYGWWFDWGRWWPLILIGLGVWMMYRREPAPAGPAVGTPAEGTPAEGMPSAPSAAEAPAAAGRRRYPTGAIVLIGVGLAFLLDDVIGGSAFPAMVLIAIGVAILLRNRSGS